MKIIFKQIPIVFLLLAVLGYTGHLFILHDHHLGGTGSHEEDTCPAAAEKSGHSAGFPIHCHAFNDITSEKAMSFQFNPIIQHIDISLLCLEPSQLVRALDAIRLFYELKTPIPDFYLLELSDLRAPPGLF